MDDQLNAKIADLELGVTATEVDDGKQWVTKIMKRFGGCVRKVDPSQTEEARLDRFSMHNKCVDQPDDDKDVFLANWAAPEVILTKQYIHASDMYSFGVVLWEIFSLKIPYAAIEEQYEIRNKVLIESKLYLMFFIVLL